MLLPCHRQLTCWSSTWLPILNSLNMGNFGKYVSGLFITLNKSTQSVQLLVELHGDKQIISACAHAATSYMHRINRQTYIAQTNTMGTAQNALEKFVL